MKSKKDLRELYDECIEFWGVKAQLRQTQEECAELILAISHFLRNRPNSLKNLVEETADVYLMLNQIIRIVGKSNVMKVVDFKSDRVKDKLERYKKKESI